MRARQLSGWQLVTLIMAFSAVIAVAAVALILGKDAVIGIVVVDRDRRRAGVLVPERLMRRFPDTCDTGRRCVSKEA